MPNRTPTDSEDTAEHEVPEFDGAQTDQLDDTYRMRVVSASENGKGTVDHDDRGRARWKWATEASSAATDTGTFDLIKALDNDALSVTDEHPAADPARANLDTGYNPYDALVEDRPPRGAKRNVRKPRSAT